MGALENEEDTELSPDSDVTAERNLPQTGGRAQPDKVLKALRRESAGDSTLSKYFTEMAQHRVLSPQEEVEAAKEVQRLETDYWVVLFSYLPAFETVAAVVERSLEQPLEEVAALRELSVGAKDNGQKLKKGETTKWKKVSGELSAKLRELDGDRVFVKEADKAVHRLAGQYAAERDIEGDDIR